MKRQFHWMRHPVARSNIRQEHHIQSRSVIRRAPRRNKRWLIPYRATPIGALMSDLNTYLRAAAKHQEQLNNARIILSQHLHPT